MKHQKLYLLALLVLFLTALACNIQSTQTTPSFDSETKTALPSQIMDTNTPAATFTFTPSPTITFTPMPTQQLATNKQINFNQPYPLSTPIADPNSVSGAIYNGYGPIIIAHVLISKTYCGQPIQETKTDEQGRYILTNIEAGRYYLDVHLGSISSVCGEEIIKNSSALAKDIILPRNGLVMVFPRDKQTVTEIRPTIEWKAVAGASFYVVELTVQISGESGWKGSWTGQFIGTWLTNSTTFTIPYDLNVTKDYKLNIIAYTAERLPLVTAFEIRFHY